MTALNPIPGPSRSEDVAGLGGGEADGADGALVPGEEEPVADGQGAQVHGHDVGGVGAHWEDEEGRSGLDVELEPRAPRSKLLHAASGRRLADAVHHALVGGDSMGNLLLDFGLELHYN